MHRRRESHIFRNIPDKLEFPGAEGELTTFESLTLIQWATEDMTINSAFMAHAMATLTNHLRDSFDKNEACEFIIGL